MNFDVWSFVDSMRLVFCSLAVFHRFRCFFKRHPVLIIVRLYFFLIDTGTDAWRRSRCVTFRRRRSRAFWRLCRLPAGSASPAAGLRPEAARIAKTLLHRCSLETVSVFKKSNNVIAFSFLFSRCLVTLFNCTVSISNTFPSFAR